MRIWEKRVLEDSGYTVVEAVDGQDAIDKFRMHRDSVQLLISDVIMPKRSGLEVYEEAKRLKPGIKAIFASGYPSDIIQKHEMPGHNPKVVPKPLSPHDFLRKVREALDE